MSYYCEKQWVKAEEYLKNVLKKNPDEAAVYNNLALIFLETGRLSEAKESIIKALKLQPKSAEILETARRVQRAKSEKL